MDLERVRILLELAAEQCPHWCGLLREAIEQSVQACRETQRYERDKERARYADIIAAKDEGGR